MFCAAVIRAVHKYGGLLRASVASATNDHRLGANEAPPAIISIFLGDQLTDVFDQIAKGGATSSKEKGTLIDRRRHAAGAARPTPATATAPARSPSPATGSSSAPRARCSRSPARWSRSTRSSPRRSTTSPPSSRRASPTATDFNAAVQKLLEEIITEHGSVVFNGDGYSEDWQIEAEARGPAEPAHHARRPARARSPTRRIELFEHYGVFTPREMHSRYEIALEQYALSIGVEARLTLEMATTVILPAALRYQTELATNVASLKAVGIDADTTTLDEVTGGDRRPARRHRRAARRSWPHDGGDDSRTRPRTPAPSCCRRWPRCATAADELEALVADDLWPLPTYQEMLFIL